MTNSIELQKAYFWASPEETLQSTRWDGGGTTISNEDRYELFQSHIQNLGGGYFGVGSIQNFTFVSWARSEWVWLMDFTKVVVAANQIHIAFLKEAETPQIFRRLWSKKGKKEAYRIIYTEYHDAENYKFIRKTWKKARPFLRQRFRLLDQLTETYQYNTWLNDINNYTHLRKLALSRKIRALQGDLTGDITVKGIAAAAKNMNVKLRVIYFSNAEEYFKYKTKKGALKSGYSKSFRESWIKMPFDEKSTVIRTVSFLKNIYRWPEGSEHSTDRGFHYNIMSGNLFQKWLAQKSPVGVVTILKTSKNFGELGYSIAKKVPVGHKKFQIKK